MPERKRPSKKNQKVKESKFKIKERMADILELPKEVVLNIPRITMVGNGNLYIENYKGIIEYENTQVRINTGSGVIRIQGNHLTIKEITAENIMVDGEINLLAFSG